MNVPTTPGTRGRARHSKAAIVRRVAAISALALTMFGLSVSPASAGSDERIKTKRGEVNFLHYGDVLGAEDTKRDGLGIVAYLNWQGDLYDTDLVIQDDNGADNGGVAQSALLRERTRVWLMMCYVNKKGDWVECSDWQQARA